MAYKCDIALLCELVEGRSCLWDKRHKDFKNKIAREKAWEEVFKFIDDEYEGKTSEQKTDTGSKIVNKWNNVRDAFVRSLRTKSGQAAKKKYIYHDNLQFLLACHEPSETDSSTLLEDSDAPHNDTFNTSMDDSNLSPSPADAAAASSSSSSSSSSKNSRNGYKRGQNDLLEIEREIMLELKKPRIEDQKSTFFSSFEEFLSDMTETEKIQLQMDILKSISTIKAQRQIVFSYQLDDQ